METVPSLRAHQVYLLSRIGRAGRRRVAERLAPEGMTMRDVAVLGYLADLGPAAQRDIARLLEIDPSDLVGAVDGLEERDWVRRERDPGDRRRYLVRLLPAGRAALRRARRRIEAVEADLLGGLTAAQRQVLGELLGVVFDSLGPGAASPDSR